MKARIKATGEIVEVKYLSEDKYGNKYYNVTTDTRTYRETELEMMSDNGDYFYTYDYWTRLEHTYVGMFMKSFLDNFDGAATIEQLSDDAIALAHALVEKMKEERK